MILAKIVNIGTTRFDPLNSVPYSSSLSLYTFVLQWAMMIFYAYVLEQIFKLLYILFTKFISCFNFIVLRRTCGDYLTAPRGIISSPLYPKNYRNNEECEWIITVDEGNFVSLGFTNFTLEGRSPCNYDSATVIISFFYISSYFFHF